VIVPRDDQLAPPPVATSGWDVETLPPELDYFRRSEAYQVELSVFQGPLDLLLFLIQKDQIDIYDIPISRITEQFIRHIEIMQMVSLDQAGEFMTMAATLLVIKMKMLMPTPAGELEEEEQEDPRAELVRRLLEYKRFKEAASRLRECEDQRTQYHTRAARYPFIGEVEVEPELRIEMYDLLSALADIFDRVKTRPVHEVRREPFTVVEKIALVRARLAGSDTVRFEDCFRDDAIKMEVIVTFIAILEMVKRGEVAIFQTEIHGPIWLRAREDAPVVDVQEVQG
jgi:segregation and condensation protein A